MARDPVAFRNKLLRDIGRMGMSFVRPKIPSKTLRRSMRFEPQPTTIGVAGRIHIPHYWALYVHEGRGPFAMPRGRFMVWFKDPRQDPRLRDGKTPERVSQLRHLTAEEFYAAVQLDQVIVTNRIRKATPPTPFFSNEAGGGMEGFANHVNQSTNAQVRKYLLNQIGKDVLNVSDTAEAVIL